MQRLAANTSVFSCSSFRWCLSFSSQCGLDATTGRRKGGKKTNEELARMWRNCVVGAERYLRKKKSGIALYAMAAAHSAALRKDMDLECVEAGEKSSRIASKLYKQKVLKIHPDKAGEAFRPRFEKFKKLIDLVKNDRMRSSYFPQMTIVARTMPPMLPKASELYLKQLEEKELHSEQAAQAAYRGKEKSTKMLAIESGELSTQPKKPMLLGWMREHVAKFQLEVPSGWEMLMPVKLKYQVRDLRTDEIVAEKKIAVATLKKEHEIDFKTFGDYEMRFCVENSSHFGPWCAWSDIRHTDPRVEKARKRRARIVEIVALRETQLRSCINRSEDFMEKTLLQADKDLGIAAGHNVTQDMQKTSNALHKHTVRGTEAARDMRNSLRMGNYSLDNNERLENKCRSLEVLVERGRELLKEIEKRLNKRNTKDASRYFVRFVGNMLESHTFDEWLNDRSVSTEDIESIGGEMNRLYQILVEGRGDLALSSYVLSAAALRDDWFTEKQCEALVDMAKEMEEEEEKIEEEEKLELEELQAREKRMLEMEQKIAHKKDNPVAEPEPEPDTAQSFEGKKVILKNMNGDDVLLNGRGGEVQVRASSTCN